MKTKRTRSAGVTAKPHSMPNCPSDENQKRARPQTLATRSAKAPGPDIRYPGTVERRGLMVNEVTGCRAMERTRGGTRTSRAKTATATEMKKQGRDLTAVASPRSARLIVLIAGWPPADYRAS